MSSLNGIVQNHAISGLLPDYGAQDYYGVYNVLTVKQTTYVKQFNHISLRGSRGNACRSNDELTHMVKLEMKAEEGRSTSKAASLVTGSWFHTELWTVVTA